MSNVFGFSTDVSAGGDFIPIIKYDARSGRIFRIERQLDSTGGFESVPVDITQTFKAVVDFENIETGWLLFAANSPPSFALVPIGQAQPPRPSEQHKNGVRFTLKLNKTCAGGDKQVREIAGVAKSFLGGVEQVYAEYLREKVKYPGQLPVLTLAATIPVTTGNGAIKSTNYRPTFRIDGWAKRPDDLIHTATPVPQAATNGSAAPSTGGQTVPPPNSFQQGNAGAAGHANLDDDFG